ncbi:MAG: hypothetical protein ACXVDD_21075, partial [Polyangia bacterium]
IGGVRTAPKCGGPARTVVASETIPTFAVDAGWLYSAAADGDTLLLRTPRHGGAATALAGPLRVAFLAADGGNVYFRGGADIETISRVPIRGGAVSTVGAAPGGGSFTTFIAVDERAVYFLSEDAVWRLAKSGGAAEAIAVHQPMPQGIAVDAGDVYWSTAPDPFGGSIRRVPKRCRAQ